SLSFLAAMEILVALLAVCSLASGQIITPYECHCGVFRSYPQGESLIYHLPGHHIDCDSPDKETQCYDACVQDWDVFAGNGDLNTVLENGYSLGQEICVGALELGHFNIRDEIGYVFSRACFGNWEDTGSHTEQYVCCHNGHYEECTKTVANNMAAVTNKPGINTVN
ncbi:unnamed protein product, partial [Meganyctiphanes norvegica]